MDKLTLSGLQYHARHGVYENERKEGNDFEVDLIFYADLESPGQTDELSATIDYQQADEIVRGVMESDSVHLIETLVQQIGNTLFDRFTQTQKLKVRVRKLHPPIKTPAAYAQIERTWKRP